MGKYEIASQSRTDSYVNGLTLFWSVTNVTYYTSTYRNSINDYAIISRTSNSFSVYSSYKAYFNTSGYKYYYVGIG